jgi:hypothetical protein
MKRIGLLPPLILLLAALAGCDNSPLTRGFTERPPEHTGGPSIFAGRVIDNGAQPLGGVIVTARRSDRIVSDPESLPVYYQGRTLANGRFDVPRHDGRAIYLTFGKPGFITHARWIYLLKGEEKTPTAPVPVTFISDDVPVVNDTIIILYDVHSVPQ